VIKSVELVKVASVRSVVPLPSDQGEMWNQVGAYLEMQGVKPVSPCFCLFHNDEFKEHDWDIEVCEPITAEMKESGSVKVRELPAVATMACTVHNGPFTTISEAYGAIGKWITDNSYRITGPCREVYLRPNENGDQNDRNTVTEIQFPVERVTK
jgi:effector-binding domain-containing protein